MCWDLLAMLLQSDDPGYVWALTVLGFWLKLAVGVVGTILSICWLLQVILYNFVSPPTSPFLAQVFITLDGIFPLFGTLAFAIFCFYLIGEFHLLGHIIRRRHVEVWCITEKMIVWAGIRETDWHHKRISRSSVPLITMHTNVQIVRHFQARVSVWRTFL